MIDDNDPMIDYYSSMLLTTYIEQSKPKNPKPKITASDEYEFMDIESWFYVGKVLLGYPENEVWEMTLGKLATLRNECLAANGFTKEEKEQSLLFI